MKRTWTRLLRFACLKAREQHKYHRLIGGGKLKPHTLVLDPTYQCMLDCISCKCQQIAKTLQDEEVLTKDEYARLIGEFKQLGGEEVSIFGGEPLMYAGLFDILGFAKENQLATSLSTNGMLLTARNTERLIEAELKSLTISIDGTHTTYETITRRKNFQALRQALQTFTHINGSHNQQAIKPHVHVTVMRGNIHGLNHILGLAEEFHIPTVSFQYISRVDEQVNQATAERIGAQFRPELNHWDIDAGLLLGINQMAELRQEIARLNDTAQRLGISISMDPALDHCFNADHLQRGFFPLNLHCFTLWESIFVGPDGQLSICPMLTHYPIANAKTIRLADFWEHDPTLTQVRDILLKEKYLPICHYCCLHTRMMC